MTRLRGMRSSSRARVAVGGGAQLAQAQAVGHFGGLVQRAGAAVVGQGAGAQKRLPVAEAFLVLLLPPGREAAQGQAEQGVERGVVVEHGHVEEPEAEAVGAVLLVVVDPAAVKLPVEDGERVDFPAGGGGQLGRPGQGLRIKPREPSHGRFGGRRSGVGSCSYRSSPRFVVGPAYFPAGVFLAARG